MPMSTHAAALAALALLAGLSACSGNKADTDALDNQLVDGIAADRDPSLADALGNQIVVDPARAGGRSGETLGQRATGQAAGRPGMLRPDCEKQYRYDAGWAKRLPVALPLFPQAKLSEAAGTDAPGCRMRIVSFTSTAPAEKILAYYQSSATRAGYSADRRSEAGDIVLAGTHGEEAYYLIATPAAGGGTAVDLVANHGR